MNGNDFAAQIDHAMRALFVQQGRGTAWSASPDPRRIEAISRARLRLGIYNKTQVTHALAQWVPLVDDALADLLLQQAQQEHGHAALFRDRLRALGAAEAPFTPPAAWWWLWQGLMHPRDEVDVLEYSAALHSLVEAWAALYSSQAFLEVLEPVDPDTAAIYRDVVLPDERFHHQVGNTILATLATTPERQARARLGLERARLLYPLLQADNQRLADAELAALTSGRAGERSAAAPASGQHSRPQPPDPDA
jgi:hypothetical protein